MVLRLGDAALQRGEVVIRAGDVVSAAEIEPLHPGQKVAEFLLYDGQRLGQCVGVLLAESVEVQSVQQLRQGGVLLHGGVPLGAGRAQPTARGAGVVDLMAVLR